MDKLLERIHDQIPDLKAKLADWDANAIEVSAWTVGDHLEHLLRAHLAILQTIEKHIYSEPEKGKRLNIFGRMVLWFGYFPTGFGNAPNLSTPKGCSKSDLSDFFTEFEATCERLKQKIPALTKSYYAFPHPFFGQMSVKQWLRLIEVHTQHHLRIIESILSHK